MSKVTVKQKICYIEVEDLKNLFKRDLGDIKESHSPRGTKQELVKQIFKEVPQHRVEFKVDNFLRK